MFICIDQLLNIFIFLYFNENYLNFEYPIIITFCESMFPTIENMNDLFYKVTLFVDVSI